MTGVERRVQPSASHAGFDDLRDREANQTGWPDQSVLADAVVSKNPDDHTLMP
jgi:hypothetical protein